MSTAYFPKTSMMRLRFWLLVWDVTFALGLRRANDFALVKASAATDWGEP